MSTASHPALAAVLSLVTLLQPCVSNAETLVVRFPEGSLHGFLVLRTEEGKTIASGDLIQVVQRNRVRTHLVFRFRNGSIDDETVSFTQQGQFRLITDRHIQKGPSFPDPIDYSMDATTGQVIIRSRKNGRLTTKKERIDFTPDLVNGMMLTVIKNIPANSKETKLSYFAAGPKPRLVKLSIVPADTETFSVAGARHEATRFNVKIELGGIAGILAPLVGKQPPDVQVWVVGGEAPAFVKLKGPLYLGGPVWTIEMASPIWQPAVNVARPRS